MTRFVAIRLVEIAVMLVLMSLVIYALIGLMPGDPIDLMIGVDPHLTSADVVRLKALYGVDQPLIARYLAWAHAALAGDLGYSRLFSAPVASTLAPRLANSLVLMGSSFALAFGLALPLGIAAARRPGSGLDAAINLGCFAGVSLPTFWLALLLILAFAAGLHWLPAGGIATAGDGGGADRLRHLALPVATLTIANLGAYTRYVRAAMRDALGQDHIRTARAKGAGEARVIWHHALRAALVPIATILALSFGGLVSGALVTETMFAYPGMGKLIFDAVMGNDYNLALAALLLATAVTMLANFAADLAYVWLDPADILSVKLPLLLLAAIAAASLAGPLIGAALGADPAVVDLLDRFAGPSAAHPLGTDELGRDMLLRLLEGGRISLAIGLAAALAAAAVGTAVGLVAGYLGGWTDRVLMRLTDGVIALPLLPLLIVLAALDLGKLGLPDALTQSNAVSLVRIVALAVLVGWTTAARLVRGATLVTRNRDFVRAARSLGAGAPHIVWRHILPNVLGPLVVATTLSVGDIILLESVLSFLGVGVQPPLASWGSMLSNAEELISAAPLRAIYPGAMIFLTVIACNLLGDALLRHLDPRDRARG